MANDRSPNRYSGTNARNSIVHTVIFRGLSQPATLVGYVVMVRAMPTLDFGILHLMYALIPLIGAGASLGLEHVLRRYQPGFLNQNRFAAARSLFRFVAGARFGTNLIVLALIFSLWHIVGPLLKMEDYREDFVFFSFLILLYFQFRVLEISFASHMLHKISVAMQAAIAVIKLLGYGCFAALQDLSLTNAILTDTVAYGVAVAVLVAAHRRHCAVLQDSQQAPITVDERRRMTRYGLLYNFNDAGTVPLNVRTDHLFLAALLDPLAVAVYAFYNRLAEMGIRILPVRVFHNIVQPMFFSRHGTVSSRRIAEYFTLLINSTLAIQVPLTAFVVVFHEQLVLVVFGDAFIEYSLMLPVMLVFSMLNAISMPVTLAAQFVERAGIILLSKLFGIYNIVALLVLIPLLGVYGAALASGSAALMKNIFIWWHIRNVVTWLCWRRFALNVILYWGGYCAVMLIVLNYANLTPLLSLIIGIVSGVGVFAWYLRNGALGASDKQILSSLLHGRERKILMNLGVIPQSN